MDKHFHVDIHEAKNLAASLTHVRDSCIPKLLETYHCMQEQITVITHVLERASLKEDNDGQNH